MERRKRECMEFRKFAYDLLILMPVSIVALLLGFDEVAGRCIAKIQGLPTS